VKAVTGLAQGFAVWSEPEQHRRAGNETVAAALAWLDGLGDAPFFLFVHLFDAHGPFDADHPPPEYRDRFRRDDALERWLAERRFPRQVSGVHVDDANPVDVVNTYDGAVRLLDDRLAPLLERLGRPELAARAIVAVTADHGQGLGQHDFVGHGVVWREQLDVPLLLCAPGLPPGVNESLAATIDVVPTLLGLAPALADDAFRRQCQGSDLLVAGVEPRPHFGMAPARRGLLSYATTRWRLHVRPDGAPLLFDLEADPFELEDVAAREPEIVERMHKALAAEVARQRRREEIHAAGSASGATAPDPKHLEELEKLGYATDGDERE
jgi:arylsulfatase A-like enzyme